MCCNQNVKHCHQACTPDTSDLIRRAATHAAHPSVWQPQAASHLHHQCTRCAPRGNSSWPRHQQPTNIPRPAVIRAAWHQPTATAHCGTLKCCKRVQPQKQYCKYFSTGLQMPAHHHRVGCTIRPMLCSMLTLRIHVHKAHAHTQMRCASNAHTHTQMWTTHGSGRRHNRSRKNMGLCCQRGG